MTPYDEVARQSDYCMHDCNDKSDDCLMINKWLSDKTHRFII